MKEITTIFLNNNIRGLSKFYSNTHKLLYLEKAHDILACLMHCVYNQKFLFNLFRLIDNMFILKAWHLMWCIARIIVLEFWDDPCSGISPELSNLIYLQRGILDKYYKTINHKWF